MLSAWRILIFLCSGEFLKEKEQLIIFSMIPPPEKSFKSVLTRNGEPMKFICIFDSSHRTLRSTEIAVEMLGGNIKHYPTEFSTGAKGEALDSVAIIESNYGTDGMFIRDDKDPLAAKKAADAIEEYGLTMRVINCGCKDGEHPTHGLLDLNGFIEAFPDDFINGQLIIALIGDLSASRTIPSILLGFKIFNYPIKILLVGPEEENVSDEYIQKLAGSHVEVEKTTDLLWAATQAHGFYFTRIQGNLRDKIPVKLAKKFDTAYGLTEEFLRITPPHARFFHPLPANKEYDTRRDLTDKRLLHHRVAKDGPSMRAALDWELFAPDVTIEDTVSKERMVRVSGHLSNVLVRVGDISAVCIRHNDRGRINNDEWVSIAQPTDYEKWPKVLCSECRKKT